MRSEPARIRGDGEQRFGDSTEQDAVNHPRVLKCQRRKLLGQLRHCKLDMTGWYMKQIPESMGAAVEKMDADLCASACEPAETRF